MDITLSFIVIAAVYVISVVVILYSTFKDKIMKPFWKRLLAALAAFAAVAVVGCVGYMLFGPNSYVQPFITLVTALCCFFIPYLVLDYNLGQCLFIREIVKCYADDVGLIATVFYYLVSDDVPDFYMEFPAWPILVVTAVSFPFIMLFFKKLMRPALDVSGVLYSWSYTWLGPFMTNVMYAFYMQPTFTEISDFPGRKFAFVPFLWVILTFSTFIILLLALNGQSRESRLQEELHISDTQITAQQKQLEHLQSHIEDTARMRHDMKHHLLAIKGYAAKGECGEISQYLDKCISFTDLYDSGIYSGNTAVDAILGYYGYLSKEKDIKIKILVETEEQLPVVDTDICIILGNLLENAYEACVRQKREKPYIKVNIHQNGNVLVIIVENTYEGDNTQAGRSISPLKRRTGRESGLLLC